MGSEGAAALLGLEAEAAIRDPARLYHDPTFLGALRRQLEGEIGEEEAAAALLQLGFLHGLRDATRVLRQGTLDASAHAAGPGPAAPRLALRFGLRSGLAGDFEAEGTWPEAHEAEARLGAVGPSAAPSCLLSTGYSSGWLSGMFEADVIAVEVACSACGAPECRFVAREARAWAEVADARAAFALEHLEFASLREQVGRERHARPRPPSDGFDPSAAAIHLWGPVMVVPFSGADEFLAALELIGRDEEARDVSVVVIDLGYAVIDEAFGALALERVLSAVEEWGVQSILTGVSALSARVVTGLQQQHFLIHKDLSEAIAAAFQIAEIQQRPC